MDCSFVFSSLGKPPQTKLDSRSGTAHIMDFIHPKAAEIKTKLEGRLPAIASEKSGRKSTNWPLACQIAQ